MLAIVPNYVSDAIDAEIERYLLVNPTAEKDREEMYNALLMAYDEYGIIATLTKPERA